MEPYILIALLVVGPIEVDETQNSLGSNHARAVSQVP